MNQIIIDQINTPMPEGAEFTHGLDGKPIDPKPEVKPNRAERRRRAKLNKPKRKLVVPYTGVCYGCNRRSHRVMHGLKS